MKTIKNLILVVLASAALIVLVGLFFSSVSGDAVIPRQFSEARISASDASRNLARLVNDSLQNLNNVRQLQEERKPAQALDLIQYEITNIQERQDAAVVLSKNLEQMAHATDQMSPDKAERLAVEAISTGVAMVSQLVNYNDLLTQLLGVLQSRINNGEVAADGRVDEIVAEMNTSAISINDLSKEFNKLMQEFDDKYVDEDSQE